jgi:hypothetical protein
MTDWATWFRCQLQASADGLVWAVQQIDAVNLLRLPPRPGYLGTWPPARHVWHITEYERCLALPSMQQWIGERYPDDAVWPDDDATWATVQHQSLDDLLAHFQAIRHEQIALLEKLTEIDWQAPRTTLWGEKPLAMVVTKTFQHTYEHGDTLLRMALWWKDFEAREAELRANSEAM